MINSVEVPFLLGGGVISEGCSHEWFTLSWSVSTFNGVVTQGTQ